MGFGSVSASQSSVPLQEPPTQIMMPCSCNPQIFSCSSYLSHESVLVPLCPLPRSALGDKSLHVYLAQLRGVKFVDENHGITKHVGEGLVFKPMSMLDGTPYVLSHRAYIA